MAAQTGSWRIAAELAGVIGPGYTLIEGHPGGGMYDGLWFVPASLQLGERPDVFLNRNGSIHAASRVIEDSTVWSQLAAGELTANEVSQRIAEVVGAIDRPMPGREAVRFLAGVAEWAARSDGGERIEAGWYDSSGPGGSLHLRERYEAFGLTPSSNGPDGMWFVAGRDRRPLLAVDMSAETVQVPGGRPMLLSETEGSPGDEVDRLVGRR